MGLPMFVRCYMHIYDSCWVFKVFWIPLCFVVGFGFVGCVGYGRVCGVCYWLFARFWILVAEFSLFSCCVWFSGLFA